MSIAIGISSTHSCIIIPLLQRFLTKQFALQDLCFWIETENFCTTQNFKDFKARQIRKKFLNHQYFLGPQSPATKEQQSQVTGIMIFLTIHH